MQYFEQDGNRLIWRNMNETLVIEPWGENSLRVRSALVRDVVDTRYALEEPVPCGAVITLEEKTAAITNGKISAEVTLDGWRRYARITFRNQEGKILLQEIASGGALVLKSRRFEPITGGENALTVSFDGMDEHLYGMGQYQEEILDWKGCTLELAHRNSQASVPFVISSRGYGFLWHNPSIGRVTFGRNRTEWYASAVKQMDYWITAGDTPEEISRQYAAATGFAPMMPEYGLGFWQCKLRYWNQEQLLNVAREYKRRRLPIDVIVCDFYHWPKVGDFRFDPIFFPDPAAMVKELQSMGIQLMVSIWPTVSDKSENYREMVQQGLLVRAEYGEQVGLQFFEENTMFFDVTNPRATRYVWKKIKQNYYDAGIRVFWLDEAEPEYGTYDYRNFRYHMGTNLEIGNIYPQCYSRMFYENMVAEGQENPVNLVRCAWAGSQKYGALVWSGDIFSSWRDFRRQLCAGLSMGAAGIPWWTTDIGGFHNGDIRNPAFIELLIRWFQWGTYCPVMRLHGDRGPNEEVYAPDGTRMLNSGSDNEVWSFGDKAYEILTGCLHRREEMRDYVRSLMQEAHETGKPVMRGMFYCFPEDENCALLADQYMFGSRYLVAPVMEPGVDTRSVYLPAGSWRNVNTGEVILCEKGQRIDAPAPIEFMPVFERI